jgi:hypothetical protein
MRIAARSKCCAARRDMERGPGLVAIGCRASRGSVRRLRLGPDVRNQVERAADCCDEQHRGQKRNEAVDAAARAFHPWEQSVLFYFLSDIECRKRRRKARHHQARQRFVALSVVD